MLSLLGRYLHYFKVTPCVILFLKRLRRGDLFAGSLAKAIFLHLQASAQQQGVSSLYLLTNSAEDYFKVLGFSPVIRSEVPLAIQNTDQFSSLCPGIATVMALNLS